VGAAAAQLRDALAFRREAGAASLLDFPASRYAPPETLRRFFPCGFAGVDKEGSVILHERIGALDITGLTGTSGAVPLDAFLQWVVW
jgi:hypothetical protein